MSWKKVTIIVFLSAGKWTVLWLWFCFPASFYPSLREGMGTSSRRFPYFTTCHSLISIVKHFYWLLRRQYNIWKDQELNSEEKRGGRVEGKWLEDKGRSAAVNILINLSQKKVQIFPVSFKA